MKHYRTVVIDGKKILRRTTIVLIATVVAVLAVVNIRIADPEHKLTKNLFDGKRIVEEVVPSFGDSEGETLGGMIARRVRKAFTFVLSFDPTDGRTAIFGEIPVVRAVSFGYLARTASEVQTAFNPKDADKGEGGAEPDAPKGKTLPIKEVGAGKANEKNKISIRNETTFSIDVEEMLRAPLAIDMKGDGAKVLIVHTHGTESYSPEGASSYNTDKSDRTLDKELNVVKVGAEMKNIIEQRGIKVIHDTTLHDHPNFNGSYENARKTIEKHLKENPGICVVLDVHRDAFLYDDGSKAKFVSEQNGKKMAQLMFVVGTNSGGLEHPDWKENMKLALKLQNRIEEKYPGLMRGVNLRKERFNGHLTHGSLIIEVGSSGNTLNEAVAGASCAASVIGDVLASMK